MVTFIISAEETVPIANPRSGNRAGDAILHYKPAGGTMPLPINVLLGEYMDVCFATTASSAAPHFTLNGKRVHPSSVILA